MNIDAVLGNLYGALREGGTFGACLQVVGSVLKSHVSAVHHEDFEAEHHHAEIVGALTHDEISSVQTDYETGWGPSENPWIKAGLHALLSRGYDFGDDHLTERQLTTSPYYRHCLKPVSVRHGLGVCLWSDGPGKLAIASFNRTARLGPFTNEERAMVASVHPHLTNAYSIHRHNVALESSNRTLRAMSNEVVAAMLVVTPDAGIVDLNASAQELLRDADYLYRSHNNRLCVRHLNQEAFKVILATAISDVHGRSLAVAAPGSTLPGGLTLHLHAIPPNGWHPSPRVILFASPTQKRYCRASATQLLKTALQLTSGEANLLLALRELCDLDGASRTLSISVTTARTHLHRAFQKTGCRKQAELLALAESVLSSAPRSLVLH